MTMAPHAVYIPNASTGRPRKRQTQNKEFYLDLGACRVQQ